MARVIVVEGWEASYDEPIAVTAGEVLELTDRTESWDGHTWIWAAAPDGREGWVPDDLPEACAAQFVAAYDYTAAELTCAAGEELTCSRETHGWSWCESAAGEAGWVPSGNLTRR